jgi:thiopeptide-type bacteriocin biosynthesis protein
MSDPWLAIHIFYTANIRPLVKECVRPLVRELSADGLLENYFFINYWVEGPHLRLRLQPSSATAAPVVRARAEAAITLFLRARPALYNVQAEFFVDMYNTLFDLEFSQEERKKYLGADGRMRQRDNNTFSYEQYEPEYGKYGGPAGVELAEWHFRHSSDLVMDVVHAMNTHVRTVLLGTAAQLMMVMSTAFLQDKSATQEYLRRYHDFWSRAFTETTFVKDVDYDEAYEAMAASVERRFADIRNAFAAGTTGELPGFISAWFTHCLELRGRARELASRGELIFQSWDGTSEEVMTDPDAAIERLLSPYLHMTNNRLQVTLSDEAYLAHVLARALGEAPVGVTP